MTIRSVSTTLIVALCIVAGQRAVSTQTAPAGPYFISDLGTLGGAESRALGLSTGPAQTVGSASRTDNSVHAFLFVKTMTDLGNARRRVQCGDRRQSLPEPSSAVRR